MHICQVIDSLAIGGAQKVVINFCKYARAHGIEVSVVVLSTAKTDTMRNELEKTGVPIYNIYASKISDPMRILKLIRFFRQQKVDFIHTHLSYANILGSLTGFLAGVPVVCTLHSARIRHEYYREILFRAEVFGMRFLSKGVICVAQAVVDVYQGYIGKNKAFVIHNPVDTLSTFSPEENAATRTELMGDVNKTMLLSVGRLIEAKGYCDMIDAFARIAPVHPNARLFIVGPGRFKDSLQEQIVRLGLSDRAVLLGERSDVSRLLAAADLYLCSSHWEGMPIAVLEAMAAGLPIVSTNVAGLPDMIGDRGVLVPAKNPPAFAQAVIDLLARPEEMRRLGLLAKKYVQERHSLETWGGQLIAYFNTFLHRKITVQTSVIGE